MDALDPALDGGFDLVVIADTLYDLERVDDQNLKMMAARIARSLVPRGLCLLANHHFHAGDRDSGLSRRIDDAFAWSSGYDLISLQRRPFDLTSLFSLAVPALGTV